jgi:predicted transposase YdaD
VGWLGAASIYLSRGGKPTQVALAASNIINIEKIQEAQQVGEARGRQEGRTEGRTEEGQALILRQLTRRVGNVSIETEIQVKAS